MHRWAVKVARWWALGMARHGSCVTSCTSPAFFRLQVMGNWWTWLRRTPSDSGRMQRSDDDTADERFLLLDYEQKQRFERWAAKLRACIPSCMLSWDEGVLWSHYSQWVVLYSADICLTPSNQITKLLINFAIFMTRWCIRSRDVGLM